MKISNICYSQYCLVYIRSICTMFAKPTRKPVRKPVQKPTQNSPQKSTQKSNIPRLTKPLYIMMPLEYNGHDITSFKERGDYILLNGNKPSHDKRHITVMELRPFNDNRLIQSYLTSKDFLTFVRQMYDMYLGDTTLIHIQKDFVMLGKNGTNLFYGKQFQLTDREKDRIGYFNNAIFNNIKQYMISNVNARVRCDIDETSETDWIVFSYDDEKAFAVPRHSWKVWRPHVSIVNTGDIKDHNIELYNEFFDSWDTTKSTINKNKALAVIFKYTSVNMSTVLTAYGARKTTDGTPRDKVLPFSDINLKVGDTLHVTYGKDGSDGEWYI